jgi:AraC-like DNA-binding protein
MPAHVTPHQEHPQVKPQRRSMIMTSDRTVYSGLLGSPSTRKHGAHTVYIAHETPFEIAIDGAAPECAWLAVVPANVVHRITSSDRLIRDLLVEPESAALADLAIWDARGVPAPTAEYLKLRRAFDEWLTGRDFAVSNAAELDRFFFGRPLAPRTLDPRIQRVAARIRTSPHEQISATEFAHLTSLSFSRFVHLFKQEIGMTLRAFCAWKRARAALPSMTGRCNLTQLALEAGYPDSTHFSHSIRRIFGLRPRDILAGSRRMSLNCPDSARLAWMQAAGRATPQRLRSFAAGL